MRIKIEFELEDNDLATLIKSMALLFSKMDISKLVPEPQIKVSTSEVNTGYVPTDINTGHDTNPTIYYDNGSGARALDVEKKNEE